MGARAAFSRCMDILFKGMGARALYKRKDELEKKEILVVYRMPDRTFDVQDSFISSSSNIFEVRVSDVRAPKAGDEISIDAKSFLVQGEAERDQHGFVWKLNVVEK